MNDAGQQSEHQRPRVLISAYACGPVEEPEAAAAWGFACAAAAQHDVWVITRPRFRSVIEAAFASKPDLRDRICVNYLDLSPRLTRWKLHPGGLYWYYFLWQRALTRRAVELHSDLGFDVMHHVTFASDWLPCGLVNLPSVPLIWGPVGGASRSPLPFARWLGARGVAVEFARLAVVAPLRRVFGDRAARRAALVVAQNPDVAERFRDRARDVVVEANAALDSDLPVRTPRAPGTPPTAVFVGRLLRWKGSRLAVEAIARPECRDWRLVVYGDGYDARGLRSRAKHLGVDDRVTFMGHRPRPEVLSAMAAADAMIFPSLHDQAGWVAAEASAIGCPVVCLPLGGPPLLAGSNAFVASVDGDVVGGLADQLTRALREGGKPDARWRSSRLAGLVDRWYAQAITRSEENHTS